MTKTNDWRERFNETFKFLDFTTRGVLKTFFEAELKNQRDEIRKWVLEANMPDMSKSEMTEYLLKNLDNH